MYISIDLRVHLGFPLGGGYFSCTARKILYSFYNKNQKLYNPPFNYKISRSKFSRGEGRSLGGGFDLAVGGCGGPPFLLLPREQPSNAVSLPCRNTVGIGLHSSGYCPWTRIQGNSNPFGNSVMGRGGGRGPRKPAHCGRTPPRGAAFPPYLE